MAGRAGPCPKCKCIIKVRGEPAAVATDSASVNRVAASKQAAPAPGTTNGAAKTKAELPKPLIPPAKKPEVSPAKKAVVADAEDDVVEAELAEETPPRKKTSNHVPIPAKEAEDTAHEPVEAVQADEAETVTEDGANSGDASSTKDLPGALTPCGADEDPFANLNVPQDVQEAIRAELTRGERIVWVGQQSVEMNLQKIRLVFYIFGGILVFMGLMGLLLAVLLVFTTSQRAGGGIGMAVGAIPVIGVLVVWGMAVLFFLAPRLVKGFVSPRCYALSNRRALVYVMRNRVDTYGPDKICKMECKESDRWKGAGSLVFDYDLRSIRIGGSGTLSGKNLEKVKRRGRPLGFTDIENVRAVERLVRETLLERRIPPPSDDADVVKSADNNASEEVVLDPNLKHAPGVSLAESSDADDPNIKAAPGANGSKRRPVVNKTMTEQDVKDAADRTSEVFDASNLAPHLKKMVEDELSKGERLVWLGQPDPKIVVVKSLPFAILLFLTFFVCGLGSLVICYFMNRQTAELKQVMPLIVGICTIFMLIGIVAGLNPLRKYWIARRTCYTLTSRRAIVWGSSLLGQQSMVVYSPAMLVRMRRKDSFIFKDGAGDVIFRTHTVIITQRGRRGSTFASEIRYGFIAIRRAREVEVLVRETLVDPLVDKMTN
jgi:hypothetical protein